MGLHQTNSMTDANDQNSIRFYFSFRSPYAWLAAERVEADKVFNAEQDAVKKEAAKVVLEQKANAAKGAAEKAKIAADAAAKSETERLAAAKVATDKAAAADAGGDAAEHQIDQLLQFRLDLVLGEGGEH